MTYQPKPIPTGDVILDKSLADLQEVLARNNHDHWAAARLAEGWTHGAERDDRLKTHPCLVPYEALPESEKEYDRRTAMEALKTILKLGYKLVPNHAPGTSPDQGAPFPHAELVSRMKSQPVKLSRLQQIWRERDKSQWMTGPPVLYRTMGELACKIGEPFFAYDVVKEGLEIFSKDRRLLQLQAWALAQSGATHAAETLLLGLHLDRSDDTETIGLLGRCYKDFGRMAADAGQRKAFFRKSAEMYRRGFAVTQSSYLGLNAATLFFMIDEPVLAKELAVQALAACRREMEAIPDDAWHCATLAELALLLDEPDVETPYKKFRAVAGNDFGVLFSARRQARLLLIKKGLPGDFLDPCLRVPRVVVFAGHMIDSEARNPPRFPASLEPIVREQIEKTLEAVDVGIAFSSAACGSDILFLEAMLARDKEYHVVLPLAPGIFRKKCVVEIAGNTWGERFDRVLAGAAGVTVANPQDTSLNPTSLLFGNQLVYGMARIRAKTIGSSLQAIALWNEKPGDGEGGTAYAVDAWKAHGEDVLILNPFPQSPGSTPAPRPLPAPPFENEIRAILFADIVGYSKLNEDDIPLYARYFLAELGALVDRSPHRPLTKNTWGDALFFVFDNVRNAGLLALEIQRFICEPGKWIKLGFSKSLSLRTALHAGPVYSIFDGITGRQTYCGAHVNRAARIELITQEGQIFVSEQFAALAEAEDLSDFHCDYVGEKELPKQSGRIRAHTLRRA